MAMTMNFLRLARSLAATIFVLSLASCDGTGTSSQPASPLRASLSTSNPRPLALYVVASPIPNGARLVGTTNLPDGTELMLNLSRASVSAGEKVMVSGGTFAQDLRPRDGKAIPPGDYEVWIMSPLGSLQPEAVKAQLGPEYEALTGPLLVRDEIGRVIEYRSKINLGGAPNLAADRAARKRAYDEHVAFSERTCRSNPDTLERMTGTRLSPQQRAENVQRCLKAMAASREELTAEGLVER